ncbi:unnamed protein product [Medioppia subpectinata]|uniref:C2H2-type domain-containing protein n=1 Tax=Medioppia subpectinata TaxID=1979941 RepID=A0A7R9Q6W5_9ACAR|nr:unnamed protein product [Medioppia subpectinata]CAG2114159.1 unnamed protein product [Medioppia subpectinata]
MSHMYRNYSANVLSMFTDPNASVSLPVEDSPLTPLTDNTTANIKQEPLAVDADEEFIGYGMDFDDDGDGGEVDAGDGDEDMQNSSSQMENHYPAFNFMTAYNEMIAINGGTGGSTPTNSTTGGAIDYDYLLAQSSSANAAAVASASATAAAPPPGRPPPKPRGRPPPAVDLYPFKCQYCTKKFRDRARLRVHITKDHNLPAFECEHCHWKGHNIMALNTHKLMHA